MQQQITFAARRATRSSRDHEEEDFSCSEPSAEAVESKKDTSDPLHERQGPGEGEGREDGKGVHLRQPVTEKKEQLKGKGSATAGASSSSMHQKRLDAWFSQASERKEVSKEKETCPVFKR